MKKLLVCLLLGCTAVLAQVPKKQAIRNDFFVLHNAIRGDSTYKTFDQQVALVKGLGYDGIEINQLESFDGMKAALDKHTFTGSYFYVKVSLDAPGLDPRIATDIQALKGSKTIIAPFIVGDKKQFPPSSHGADTTVVRLLNQIGDWAQQAGLSVALYPHVGFYIERTDHALNVVKQVNRPNVGLTFNLCHWLATTQQAERTDWKAQLKAMRPSLKMITVCGANDVPLETTRNDLWANYILPLGTGRFDTYELIRYVVRDLAFTGPIGVQFYAMKGDKPTNLRNTMATWTEYKRRLANK